MAAATAAPAPRAAAAPHLSQARPASSGREGAPTRTGEGDLAVVVKTVLGSHFGR